MPSTIRLSDEEILADERSEAACSFLRRAMEWFARWNMGEVVRGHVYQLEALLVEASQALDIDVLQLGRIRIERVMTDNGSAFVSRQFTALCQSLQIRHIRIRPYTPRANGKAERFVQTRTRMGISLRE